MPLDASPGDLHVPGVEDGSGLVTCRYTQNRHLEPGEEGGRPKADYVRARLVLYSVSAPI
jgi:hypothetical protein